MTPAELHRAIADQRIPALLCLYGEERYLREQAWRRVLDAVVPVEERDFNFEQFEGREVRGNKLVDAARTLPVFAQRRLILVKDAESIPTAEQEVLLTYLQTPLPETVLLLICDKIDTRRKLFLEFKKSGALVEFKRLYDNQIPAFVRQWLREKGRALTEDAMALFCRRVGGDLQEVVGELEKLSIYLGERTLADVADVVAIVSDSRIDSIFDLTNALGAGEAATALRLLGRSLDEGEAPLKILTMLVRHFRQLWLTRELIDRGGGSRDVAVRLKINPYFVDSLVKQARRFTPEDYLRAFELFLATDLGIKSSGAHPSALLERLVLTIAAPDKK